MDESKVMRYATENYVDKNIPYTVSSKVLTTVPASNIQSNMTNTINNVSINKDRRYYIEFLGSKKLCGLLINKENVNCIACSIGNYAIQAYNDSTNILLSIINNSQPRGLNLIDDQIDTYDLSDGEIIPNATDLVIYEEEVKYLDSKYLETDLILQNSISLGRSGDIGAGSSAIGLNTTASGISSHAEGDSTTASGDYSHAEGNGTTASGDQSHAEGGYTVASGYYSHAEGSFTTASGYYSHAEGSNTTASADYSHAEGNSTKASSTNQHVQGKYNIEDKANKYAHIVGNGASDSNRSNAHTLDWQGNAWYAGKLTVSKDPTENMDVVTKKYVDDMVGDIQNTLNTIIGGGQ